MSRDLSNENLFMSICKEPVQDISITLMDSYLESGSRLSDFRHPQLYPLFGGSKT